MTSSGQSITDRALAAKHTVAGQTLAKSVCKATTEEIIPPKRKHLDHLLRCTNDPSISIPQMANLLIERTKNSSWVVVFKALVTVHTLMNNGNERFTQYLASNNCTFHLDSFYDRSNGMQGYGMSTFIRQYAKYLTQKSYSYRQMAFDFCRAKRGKEDGILRTMNTDELLRALPLIQTQFDALVGFEVAAVQITNGIVSAAFLLLFRDLIRLYACYNDGIINLLGRYFDLNKKNCREAFEIYKLFIARVDKVGQFLKVAENIGVDRGEIPDLAKAPASLLDALEQHLIALENTKKATTVTSVGRGVPCSPAGHTSAEAPRTTLATETIHAANVSPSVGRPVSTSRPVVISEAERRHILEEEERMLDVIKQQNLKHSAAAGKSAAAAASPSTQPPNVGAQRLAVSARAELNPFDQLNHEFDLPPVPPSHDLLGLQQWPSLFQPAPSANGSSFPDDDGLFFQSSGILNPSPLLSAESNRTDLFGGSTFSGFDLMVKTGSTSPAPMMQARLTPTDFGAPASPHVLRLGGTSTGTATRPTAEAEKSQRLITGNLDASLASIAGNLSVGTPEHYRRADHNWAGPTERRLTGAGAAAAGNLWTPPGSSSPAIYPSSTPAPLNMGGPQSTAMTTGYHYPAMVTAYPVVMGQPMTVMDSAPKGSTIFVSHSASDAKLTTTTLPQHDPFGFL